MFYALLFGIGLGIGCGIITGLIPGIHVNLIAIMVLSYASLLLDYFSVFTLGCFIISLAVTHTFLDAIPTIYLGMPDSATVLGVLPGHRYLLKGWGYMAVKLTLIGSFFGLIIGVLMMPLLFFVVRLAYPILKSLMVIILLMVFVFMVFRDKRKVWSIIVFVLSGGLGWLVLNTYNLKYPIFPLLTGIFGMSTLLFSLRSMSSVPEQMISSEIKLRNKVVFKSLFASVLAGFLTSMLPGIGASQGTVIGKEFAGEVGDHGFMVILGGVNTVNFVLSLVTLFVLSKARNGAVVAVQELIGKLGFNHLFAFIAVALIVGGVGVGLTLFFGRVFSKFISRVNYRGMVFSVVLFIIILTPFVSGFVGLFVLFTATMLGLIPAIVKCSRTHAMGCLMIPVMMWFLL